MCFTYFFDCMVPPETVEMPEDDDEMWQSMSNDMERIMENVRAFHF